ncbi:Uncharacterised protein [Escherichia coli]|nr:Uncharacterised protein [Escherichia coli]
MRDDFCAFILTHGRPDKVLTYRTLRRAGYARLRINQLSTILLRFMILYQGSYNDTR